MRTLLLTPAHPCDLGGSQIRAALTVGGLAAVGTVDVFHLTGFPTVTVVNGLTVPARRIRSVCGVRTDESRSSQIRWLLQGRVPAQVWHVDAERLRTELRAFIGNERYDLVWHYTAEPWHLTHDLFDCPQVVDLCDRESTRVRAEQSGAFTPWSAEGRRWARRLRGALDARRWDALQRRALEGATATAMCNPREAQEIGDGVHLLPNGYALPSTPVQRRPEAATFLLVGSLQYLPNQDGAVYLVEDVLPVLRTLLPATRLRMVGDAPGRLRALHAPPQIEVLGRVVDIAPEMSRATAIIVPLRLGSGTRLKILEAFAYEVPVISTTVGADGLDVADGRELLIADTPEQIAVACGRLAADPRLGQELATRAKELLLRSYAGDVVTRQVTDLARSAITSGQPAP